MTTKIISNTIITTGYTLSSAYSALSITSTGTIDGAAGAPASGGMAGGKGGVGLTIPQAATIYNMGQIVGGQGGVDSGGATSGGAGGNGLNLGRGSLTNMSSIAGGQGGAGGIGGNGGAGARFYGGLTNFGTIAGGVGGAGASKGHGGHGGAGVILTGSLTNSGKIVGAAGGDSGAPTETGNGVDISTKATIVNHAGGLISGRTGVETYGSNFQSATVTNYGTIAGTYASVVFRYTTETLVAEAGSTFIGMAKGGGGSLDVLNGNETVTNLGAIGTLTGSVSMTTSEFGRYFLAGNTTLTGTNTLGVTNRLSHEVTQTLFSAGTLTVSGTVNGNGTLECGGQTTIEAGAVLTVANWLEYYQTTSLEESLAYKGTFYLYQATMDVAAGFKLSLTGSTTLNGTLDGAGVVAMGNGLVEFMTIGGTLDLSVAGSVNQYGFGRVGDTSSAAARLTILKTGVWNIAGYGDEISRGSAIGSRIVNYGLLVGRGDRVIVGVTTYDFGVIEAAKGTFTFTGALFGTGSLKIDAGDRLWANAGVGGGLTATFNGSSATLALVEPKKFAATISGFAATDVIDLVRIKATGASINASDQLVIVNGATTVASLQLTGDYSGAIFNVAADGKTGGTDITLATAASAPPSPALLAAAMAGMAPVAGATVRGHEAERFHAPMLSRPGTQFA